MKVKSIIAVLWCISAAHAEPLPDGEVTEWQGWRAELVGPTMRYAHGALGDTIEATGFTVHHGGKTVSFTLDDDHVFEDLRVRLVELDGDDAPEAVIIRSHFKRGAAIAVYDIARDGITFKAASDDIGRANRWLNIVGFGDFTGRGKTEIAAVITPHLAGSLRIYDIDGAQLKALARIDGYTNHINGTRDLDLAKVRDVNADGVLDITLPAIDGSGRATLTFKGGRPARL